MAEERELHMSDDAFIEMIGTITPDMTDEEIMTLIDEIEAEEEARIELADMARDGWR
tara:strand:- start:772 stop:942 length:171 start_codon:yes stop_codon:yes gene_type:complete